MGRQRQQGWKGVCEISTFASQVSGNATRNTQQKTNPHRAQTGRGRGRRREEDGALCGPPPPNQPWLHVPLSINGKPAMQNRLHASRHPESEGIGMKVARKKERKIWLSCNNLCETALDQLIRARLCIFVIQNVLANSMYYRLLFFTTNSALHHITSCEEFDGKKGYINKINYSHGRMGFWKWTEVEMDCATQGSHLALAI